MIKNFIVKYRWLLSIISITIVKICMLPWSSHPFDFWTFVTTVEKNIYYGWNLFESWNKGNLLVMLWYSCYSAYIKVVEIFHLESISVLMLHLFIKLPYLIVDLFCGYLIFQITLEVTKNYRIAKTSALMWLLNPIVFYVFGVHGHYEILVALGLLMSIWGLVSKKTIYLILGLVISIQVKYYFVILVPFFILYILAEKRVTKAISVIVFTILGLIISYGHFFFNTTFIKQTIDSITFLSHSTAPVGVNEVYLSKFNIFSTINSILGNNRPISNINNPLIFSIANQWMMIILVYLFIHFSIRLLIIIKKRVYSKRSLISDVLLVLVISFIFFTNFQNHYLIWIVPIMIITASIKKSSLLYILLVVFSVSGFILCLRGEYGVTYFFSDILKNFSIPGLNSVADSRIYFEGFLIVSSVAIFAIASLIKNMMPHGIETWRRYVLVVYLILNALLVFYFSSVVINLDTNTAILDYSGERSVLAFSGGSLPKGAIWGNYTIVQSTKEIVLFKDVDKYNQLILSELSKNKEIMPEFKTYIIVKHESTVNQLEKQHTIKFNNCNIDTSIISKIYDYDDRKTYLGYEIETNCLRDSGNKLVGEFSSNTDKESIELFITNVPSNKVYSTSEKLVNISGIIFVVLLPIGLLSMFVLYYKLYGKNKRN